MATGKQRPSTTHPPAPAERRPPAGGLIAVACRRCAHPLADVIAGAAVWCSACQVWTTARPPVTTTAPAPLPLH